jgi:hypothetical protein
MNSQLKVYDVDPVFGRHAKDGKITHSMRVGYTTFRPGIAVTSVLDAASRRYEMSMDPDDAIAVAEKISFERLQELDELIPQTGREFVPYGMYLSLQRELAEYQLQVLQMQRIPVPSFQQRVWEWFKSCFGPAGIKDKLQRYFRFYEEATELVQAGGMSRQDAHRMVDSVYDKAPGKVYQEVGGVATTLAMVCNAEGLELDHTADTELARVWGKQDEIREKQKQKLHPVSGVSKRLYADD